MPTYQITYTTRRRRGSTLTSTAKVFAMCKEHAVKLLYAYAKATLKKFVTVKNVEEV